MGVHQLAGDPRHIRRPQLIQRDADHAGRGAASLRHLPAPVRQVGGAVSEGGVTGEFRLPRRDQHVSRADVVGAADGIAPALAGIGHQDLAVEAYRQLLFQLPAQRLRLQRIMAPQSGVALGQQLKFSSALPCRPRQIADKLPVDPLRLPAGKAAGIGQYKNHVSRLPQGPQKRLPAPVRIDRHVMHRLDAGGAVVQHHQLAARNGPGAVQHTAHRVLIRQRRYLQRRQRQYLFVHLDCPPSQIVCSSGAPPCGRAAPRRAAFSTTPAAGPGTTAGW